MVEETGTSNVRVLCRFRPANEKEKQLFPDRNSIEFLPNNQSIIITPQSEHNDPLSFKFDYVFSPNSTQESVFEIAARPTTDAIMQGFNGTIFAYGQTSSGKTYTMMGSKVASGGGIIPRMVSTIFEKIQNSYSKIEFQVKISYCEIYMEKIKDLLEPSKTNLKIHEEKTRGVYISDLTEQYVSCESEVYELMKIGTEHRETGSTDMNADSSRSHAIFSLTITQTSLVDYSAKTGKLYLVDLAGSEKVSKTGAAGKRLEEAKNINKSLTMLGLVISALTEKANHIPYRDSKLTRILQDSLGGNSKTTLIITCSPSPFNVMETISTCRFGDRARYIKNKPKVNREYTIAELKLMLSRAREEISKKNRIILALEKSLGRSASSLQISKQDAEEEEENELNDTKMTGVYDEVISELEEARTALGEEIEKNVKIQLMISKLMEENTELKNDHTTINVQIKNLQDSLETAESHLRSKEDQVERLAIANEGYRKELEGESTKKLNTELQVIKTELENTRKQIKASTTEIQIENDVLQDELTKAKDNNEKLLNDLEKLEVNMQTLVKASSSVDKKALDVVEALHKTLKSAWFDEKRTIAKEISSRIKKATELHNELKFSEARYKKLMSGLSEGELYSQNRFDSLQRNLEQLTLMYHQLVSKESNSGVEKKISEKKIERINKKVNDLEKEAQSNRNTVEKLRFDNEKINTELKELREFKEMHMKDKNIRFRKIIRGGADTDGTITNRKTITFFIPHDSLDSTEY